ncbi:MAG: hypothetical protein AB7V77_01955 [Candidatus Woesearchaeota archaeon]
MAKNQLEEFKKQFDEEFTKIHNIDELKEIYALELAKRDKLIDDLQKENKILLKTAFKSKNN